MGNPKAFVSFVRQLSAISAGAAVVMALIAEAAIAQVPFLIDGTVPDAECCSVFEDPVGSIKELGPVNASTTKLGNIHLASPPMLEFTNPNSSTDLATVWLETRKDTSGDVWLYFAWERDTNSGSSVISYEFQSGALDPACDFSAVDQTEPASAEETAIINSCNPWSNRQAGDFLIVWDFGGGSTDIILRTFAGTSFDTGVNLTALGYAAAALNADSTRGEGSINLTDAIFGSLQTCFNVATVIPGTITGNSDQADYKDTLLADISSAVTISNCGTVRVTKATQPSGESGLFSYTLERVGGGDIDYSPRTSASGTLIDDGGENQLVVIPGTDYVLSEDLTGEPEYEMQSILCNRPIIDTDGTGAFSVEAAATTDCVITNELLTGTITVVKHVVNSFGGSARASDFCLALNDDEGTPVFAGSEDGTQFEFVIGNQYSVAEVACGSPDTSPPGYEAAYSGDCTNVIEARTDKLCTVTNTQLAQDQVSFALFKNLVTDNGGTALRSDWTLNATLKAGSPGTCTSGGISGTDGGNGVTGSLSISDNVAQCVYVLSETGGPSSGYTAGEWSCTGDASVSGSELTVGPGGGSCTITNDDDAPSLTLVKEVVNDNGGTAVAGDWTLTAAGYDAASPDAGTYALSESGPSGYTQTSLTCSNTGDAQVSSVTLGLGEAVTCTFVNDDDAPSLTLVKEVVNDNGGTAVASDWTLTAAGPTPISGNGGASSGPDFALGTYTLSEAGPGAYTPSGWSCIGGSQDGNSVTLGLGESAICTIVNDDIQPTLTLVKNVINDNGGLLDTEDFPLYVDDTRVVSGTATGFDAGQYMVSEYNQPGYEAGTWGGDCAPDGTISLDIGDTKTCTITNDDIPPELKIVKTAVEPMSIPGADMAFSITVVNIGGGDALGVTLTDRLPPADNGEDDLPPLPWTTSTEGCVVTGGGASLTCDVGTLAKDPTPDQVESGDEASFTALVSVIVPEDYLETEGLPGGSGTLGSNFEIDGDLDDIAGDDKVDWGTPGIALINILDPPLVDLSPEILIDNSFSDGSKEDDTDPTVVDHSIPPNKSDLTNFLIAEDEVDGNGFLALGWIRTDSLGTSNFDFELNQSAATSANGVTPLRTTGDVLFSFDFESSGNVVMLSLREWDGDAGMWGAPRTLNIEGTGFAAINDPALFGTAAGAEINPFTGEAMPDQTFGEAVINMTQTFQDDCRTFLRAFVKGRSSTPFTAVLKDFIAPLAVEIDTCRTIPLSNTATADASNPGQDPVSDSASVTVTNDPVYTGDADGDGIRNYRDEDDDNDGFADADDEFPFDPSEWVDTDGDGVGDNGDAFPNDPAESADTDSDGVGDNADAFPTDPSETTDSDGDGVGDNGDAFPNDPAESADTDGDGVGDNADAFPTDPSETTDSDGDGVGDNSDVFPNDPAESADTDGDGVGDNADAFPTDPSETTDSDGDGVGDNSDMFPNDPAESVDTDGDGVGDNADAFPTDPSETTDSDGDGVGDNSDVFPNDPAESADTDGDGVGDNSDVFPADPAEWLDTDGDGVGNNADAFPTDPDETTDSDGDGVGDNGDVFPNDPAESADTDGDGVGDNADAFPTDPAETTDSDGDGVGDNSDAFPNNPAESADTDGDGIGNNADADDDNDGMPDAWEDQYGLDPLSDADAALDTDGDGRSNLREFLQGTNPADATSFFVLVKDDADGDGTSDILWRNSANGQNALWTIEQGSISANVEVPAVSDTRWVIVGRGDYNGDGSADILWRKINPGQPDNGSMAIWLMSGGKRLSNAGLPAVSSEDWQVVGDGDYNGDGESDILWRNLANGRNALWLISDGSQMDNLAVQTVSNLDWEVVSDGDFDGDGRSDILWRRMSTGDLALWRMNGATRIANEAVPGGASPDWQILGDGDYDGDGKSDLLWRNSADGSNALWTMDGSTRTANLGIPRVSADWQIVGDGDYDGDGTADILWRDGSSGANAIWLMNTNSPATESNIADMPADEWIVVSID